VLDDLRGRVERLKASTDQPLLLDHLRSVQALVDVSWSAAQFDRAAGTQAARDVVTHVRGMLTTLPAERITMDDYLAGRRVLAGAFRSPTDRTLQAYRYTLPRNWKPANKYPLIVSLHAYMQDPHVLGWLGLSADPTRDPASPPPSAEAFVLMPYGRGNTGFAGTGADDVLEAIADFTSRFPTHPDRHYLTGFSMGGYGTWHIGARTPDRWAAIAPAGCFAGAGGEMFAPWLADNVDGLPVLAYAGENDGGANAEAFVEMLQLSGQAIRMEIAPGMGHTRTQASENAATAQMLRFRRHPPQAFSFSCDNDRFPGRNGITIERDPAIDPLPRFECRIDGQTVALSSRGERALHVDLGPDGLNMDGEVVVVHNGKEVYRGSPRKLTSPEPAPQP
jgi:pimeloyl-ACP methyl ester carboxylesterase